MTSVDMAYDIYKLLITLDAGAIVILIGLLERLFQKPKFKGAIVVSLVSFVVSMLGCLAMLVVINAGLASSGQYGGTSLSNFTGAFGTITAWVGFIMGIFSLVVFVIANLYSDSFQSNAE